MKQDKRALQRFRRNLKELGKKRITIGAIGQHLNSDLTNSELLTIHEFGAPKANIPARAPIRSVMNNGKSRKILEENIQQLVKQNILANGGIRIKRIVKGVGVTFEALVKAGIKRRLSPANKPATLKRKQGNVPLIDTQQLVNSIKHGVDK